MTKDAFFELVAKVRHLRGVMQELEEQVERRRGEVDVLAEKASRARGAYEEAVGRCWNAVREIEL